MPGKRRQIEERICDWCKGAGTILVPKGPADSRTYQRETCNRCGGKGRIK